LKTVWAPAHKGSNPFPSAIKSLENTTFSRLFSFIRFIPILDKIISHLDANNQLLSKIIDGILIIILDKN